MRARLAAELELDAVGVVWPVDVRRQSLAAVSGRELLGLGQRNLEVLARWALPAACDRSWHTIDTERGIAVVCAGDHVVMLECDGTRRWSHEHPAWTGDFESGCAWLTADSAFAVVPAPGYDGCDVVRLDLSTGEMRSQVTIEAYPAGVTPIYQADGWVGLSVGEGQDACKAWWVRAPSTSDEIELLAAGWTDTVLVDAAPDDGTILTTAHGQGPLTVRTFPDLSVKRRIDPPGDELWDFGACFVGGLIVARLLNDIEQPVAIDRDGNIEVLDIGAGWLAPAGQGFLTVEHDRIRRWELG